MPEVLVPTTRDALPPLDSLKCALCGDFLKDPMTLQCMHSYCQTCLEKITPPAPPAPETDSKKGGKTESPPPPPPIECTICVNRLKLPLPSTYIEPFENNRLTRIVRLVHDSNVLCQNCHETGSEVRCATCKCYLCAGCWDDTHSSQVFASHQPEALRHREMDALPKCPEHPGNELEFFCTDEETGVCQACLLKGSFKGRAYRQVSEVCEERRQEIEAGIKTVAEKREALLGAKNSALGVLNELENTKITAQQRVREQFEQLRLLLDAKEEETLKAINLLKSAKEHVLRSQVTAIDRVVGGINDGIKSARLVVDYSNDLELVYLTYVMQHHIDVLSQLPGTAPVVCPDCSKSKRRCHCPSVTGALPVQLGDSVAAAVRGFGAVAPVDPVLGLLDDAARKAAIAAAEQDDRPAPSSCCEPTTEEPVEEVSEVVHETAPGTDQTEPDTRSLPAKSVEELASADVPADDSSVPPPPPPLPEKDAAAPPATGENTTVEGEEGGCTVQ